MVAALKARMARSSASHPKSPDGHSANTKAGTVECSSSRRRDDGTKDSFTSVQPPAKTVPPAEIARSEISPLRRPTNDLSVEKSSQTVGVARHINVLASSGQNNSSTPRSVPPNPSILAVADKTDSSGRPMMPLSFHAKPTPTQVRDMVPLRIPSGSVISEVAVQSRNEGSDSEVSESSDSESEPSLSKRRQFTPMAASGQGVDVEASLEATSAGDLLKTLMRPPTKKILDSILDSFDGDDIPEKEEDTEEEEEEEEDDPRHRRLSQNIIPSRSPSAFPSDDDAIMNVDTNFMGDTGNSKGERSRDGITTPSDLNGLVEGEDRNANEDEEGLAENADDVDEEDGVEKDETNGSEAEHGEAEHEDNEDKLRKENEEDDSNDTARGGEEESGKDGDVGVSNQIDETEESSQPVDDVESSAHLTDENTPTMRGVNNRAESYISEHVANRAVEDAMAKDHAFLHGDEIPDSTQSNVDQLDGDDSDNSTKVDLLGAGARNEDAGIRCEGEGTAEGGGSDVNDVPNNNSDIGTIGPNTISSMIVLPAEQTNPGTTVDTQQIDLPSTPGRVKRMRGKSGKLPTTSESRSNKSGTPASAAAVLDDDVASSKPTTKVASRTSSRNSVVASKFDNVADPPERSQEPPRRYNTRRSVNALSQPTNSQLASSTTSKLSKPALKKSGQLKTVVEIEQDASDHPPSESQKLLEAVVENPPHSRTIPQSPTILRSSSVGDKSLGMGAEDKEAPSEDVEKRKAERASSSSAEIENTLAPSQFNDVVSSNDMHPNDGRSSSRQPSPTSSHTESEDEADIPKSSPPLPPRRIPPRLSLKKNYRSLQDLASSQDLFQSAASQSRSYMLTPVHSFGKEQEEDGEEDEDEDSSSDSDVEDKPKQPALNIPKEKMAGNSAPRPQEKRKNLLSQYF